MKGWAVHPRGNGSASFTSSYPLSRPNTGCRNIPIKSKVLGCRKPPCLEAIHLENSTTHSLTAMAGELLADARTGKNGRHAYANNPASDMTTEPRNWSIGRRSKSPDHRGQGGSGLCGFV
jgi:hypothetical protein